MSKPYEVQWSLDYFREAARVGMKTPAHRAGAALAEEVERLREIEFRMKGLDK